MSKPIEMTDEEIKHEVDYILKNKDKIYEKQQASRKRFLNDPANAEAVKRVSEKMEISKLLYEIRTKAKLTQKEVARRMNVSQPVVARIERAQGDIKLSTLQNFYKSCGAKLNLNPVWE